MHVKLDLPNREERIDQIKEFTLLHPKKCSNIRNDSDIAQIANMLGGMSSQQIEMLLMSSITRDEGLTLDTVKGITKNKLNIYGHISSITDVQLDDEIHVSGLGRLKDWLKEKRKVFFAKDEDLKIIANASNDDYGQSQIRLDKVGNNIEVTVHSKVSETEEISYQKTVVAEEKTAATKYQKIVTSGDTVATKYTYTAVDANSMTLVKPASVVANPVSGLKPLPPAANVMRTFVASAGRPSVEMTCRRELIRSSVAVRSLAVALLMTTSCV